MTTGISFQKGAGVLEDQGFGGKGEGGRYAEGTRKTEEVAVSFALKRRDVQMTKRVAIEIPEKMYFLLCKFGYLHDVHTDDSKDH